ncbi:MAG: hypothetical protein Q4B70_06990 [Lachnospiraceae bacterium]|nr:hypothetical protein [Lachnospiraceae bacterium]
MIRNKKIISCLGIVILAALIGVGMYAYAKTSAKQEVKKFAIEDDKESILVKIQDSAIDTEIMSIAFAVDQKTGKEIDYVVATASIQGEELDYLDMHENGKDNYIATFSTVGKVEKKKDVDVKLSFHLISGEESEAYDLDTVFSENEIGDSSFEKTINQRISVTEGKEVFLDRMIGNKITSMVVGTCDEDLRKDYIFSLKGKTMVYNGSAVGEQEYFFPEEGTGYLAGQETIKLQLHADHSYDEKVLSKKDVSIDGEEYEEIDTMSDETIEEKYGEEIVIQ